MSVECPGCGSATVLSDEGTPARVPSEEIAAAELQSALAGPVPRHRISMFYQFGLLLVAFFMVLLPLVYFAFACFAGYGVYWYAVHGRALFSSFTGGIYVLMLKMIIYIGPILAGGMAVFFMFKPILARSPKRIEPIELNPAQHPRLYQFIAHLSDLLKVSMPKRIYLDCDLNASAGLRRGWLSFLGNDLVLTLGLPLVAGLNTRQFASVISHELGHCTQWLAVRLGYVIYRINRWFFRVVYERDTWDRALADWSNSVEDWRLSLIVMCIHLAVWVSRRVLMLLMLIGHAVSCFLARQMEFHADACAMSVAGSPGLESLLLRMRELQMLQGLGYDGLRQFWQKRHQLPDSLPDYLDQLEKRLPSQFHEDARLPLMNEKAGWFDTHPTAARRIQIARQRGLDGIFALQKPARALFGDFEATARQVSSRHYRQNLGLAVTNPMLKPVEDFFQESVSAA
jgi:Zn-dependent protease with chaperone function